MGSLVMSIRPSLPKPYGLDAGNWFIGWHVVSKPGQAAPQSLEQLEPEPEAKPEPEL